MDYVWAIAEGGVLPPNASPNDCHEADGTPLFIARSPGFTSPNFLRASGLRDQEARSPMAPWSWAVKRMEIHCSLPVPSSSKVSILARSAEHRQCDRFSPA